ncbi:BSD [Musa troglodytarum]|uniref:BSD n=1 Tax=Musa troglodytarum TaxID=320322 RepID=A0A9E7G8I6_9LILI|nr:BSD [Musa troglodytarum]URE10468.1 BSD [Musa troglodytarum]URE10469.1 BSD [Musa troglodytarum]
MSWWARSLVNSLRGDDEEDEESAEEETSNEKSHIRSRSRSQEGEIEEIEEVGITPTRGVKDDLSDLTQTLTRQLWGVASFLAPAPVGPDGSDRTASAMSDEAALPAVAAAAESPRIAGIRSDFAEIGGKFKIGISSVLSHTKAVAEISKIASSLLPFGSDEEEGEDDGVGIDAVGVNEEVLAFARNITMHPETWLDFPLPPGDEDSDDFEMSDAQLEHALAIERLAPEFATMKAELCPSQMTEGSFWKIYFVLLHSRLNGHEVELLSTSQIVEARSILLQDLHAWTKPESEMLETEASYGKYDFATVPVEENVMGSSSTVNAVSPAALSFGEPASDSMRDTETGKHPVQTTASDSMEDFETEKHPVQTDEVKLVDKSVIEEELANQSKSKEISSQTSRDSVERYEEDGDEWLEDDTGEASKGGGLTIPLGQEDDVSFSDLEDDDDGGGEAPPESLKTVSVDSQTKDAASWVQLKKGDDSIGPKTKLSNDWLDVEDFDVE